MHDDFAFEPIPGLPEVPPEGERVLWQGKPRWWSLAKRLFKLPWIAGYFAILALWGGVSSQYDGEPLGTVVSAGLGPLIAGGVVIGLLVAVGYWIQATTIYTVTSERVIIRFGLAVQMTVNLPFRVIQEAQLTVRRDGTGDIPLVLMPDEKVSSLMLWPHIRPWHWRHTQPMLRAIAVPEAVARTLAQALADHAQRTGGADVATVGPAAGLEDGGAPTLVKASVKASG
ncbi:photosynthetic complex putative assembly protein PuhB [Roseospira navarrensis]|uniref:photosynthetic complex putative assembly protein PuhB n=1 Tax=Roseospira navarrensis TaxID=140058 RepID=UPI0012966CC2